MPVRAEAAAAAQILADRAGLVARLEQRDIVGTDTVIARATTGGTFPVDSLPPPKAN